MKHLFTAPQSSGLLNSTSYGKKSGNKISMIIADDNAEDQDLIREALKTIDNDVEHTAVYNGEQLIDLITNKGVYSSSYSYLPSAIILDLNMPVMDGLTALKIIRKLNTNNAIPVFILHTARHDDQLNECSLLGVQGIFTKPADFMTLRSILEIIYYFCGGVTKEQIH